MREYLPLGPVPCEEDCAQVGEENYRSRAIAECKRYIELLKKMHPNPTANNSFGVKWFEHDYGSYCEVVVYYDTNDKASIIWAYGVENNTPINWNGDLN